MELAGRHAAHRSVGTAVDYQRARTADTFAAVVVEYDGFLFLFHQLFVQHVQHFQERHIGRNVGHFVFLEFAFGIGTGLTPYLEC